MRKRQRYLMWPAITLMLDISFDVSAADSGSDRSSPCDKIAGKDISVQDAPMQLTSALPVMADDNLPAYCRVQAYIAPNVGFELRLPIHGWNGKFLHAGCGGFCGVMYTAACDKPLSRGYACAVSDQGHKADELSLVWAYNNIQAEIDYAYRGEHVVSLASKAIIRSYYNREIDYSYFSGCSGGGRSALVEAQLFPWDYDGIIAGDPATNIPGNMMWILWLTNSMWQKDGKPIISDADVKFVHQAVMDRCDGKDGLRDDVIENPAACDFLPSQLSCSFTHRGACLSKEKVNAFEKIYSGPVNAKGQQTYTGGLALGAELKLIEYFVVLGKVLPNFSSMGEDFFRYLAFMPDVGPAWTADKFDFDQDYKRFGMMNALLSAENPDLRRFKGAGGKLILYHAWNDLGLGARNSIDYYEMVEKAMGGRESTMDFTRLFLIPGTNHCGAGKGPFAIDFLPYLESWVERGQAPEFVIGANISQTTEEDAQLQRFSSDPKRVKFKRPIYPYPIRTKYKGIGDPNDAANFIPVVGP